MGLLQKISRLGHRCLGDHPFGDPHTSVRGLRICRFEEVESRRLMAADLHVGSVYYEQAAGDDTQPNILQFEFQGGAPGTQLTRIVIDGDKDGLGLSSGDVFFDTQPGGLGSFQSNPLHIVSHNGFQIVDTQVVDGGTRMVIDLSGFEAGEKLVLSVDVDEAQYVDSTATDTNAVVEGGEFQRSHFLASFVAPHYEDVTTSTQYWDAFDQNFASVDASTGSHLDLPPDRYVTTDDLSDFTAGAVASIKQPPKPNSLAGVVFSDNNLNNHQDPGDQGIGGVTLTLLQFDGSQYVATGLTTITDTQGNYKFDHLVLGTYRVVETQPSPYFSVGAAPGTVDGQVRGVVTTPDILSELTLLGGDDSVQNDFAEALPNSISGRVVVDTGGDCQTDPNAPPISGVTIQLLDGQGHVINTTQTDAQGHYSFDNLPPGTYGVHEVQPVGYFDGDEHAGSVGGTVTNDLITHVTLVSDIHATDYDFCELLPVSISGRVVVDTGGDCQTDPNAPPISGVTIQLLDAQGHVIGTTTTDAQGHYSFDNLAPGTYGVHEVQPAGYIDDETHAGSVGGTVADDLITNIVLVSGIHATDYDFCELLPVSISGRVVVDTGGDCQNDPEAPPIEGVTIQLLDAQGHVVGTTLTDVQGHYSFDNLPPGTYGVHEVQPVGYFDGDEHAGSAGGNVADDLITHVALASGVHATNYDFCELLPVSISGRVVVDTGGDCQNDPEAPPISGVTIQLLDAQGHVVGTTTTDAQGHYSFDNLPPGTYGVHEVQPLGYFDGDEHAGSAGGNVSNDLITNFVLVSGTHATNYDFCEVLPVGISGFVHVDTGGDCQNDPEAPPIAGVTIQLLDDTGHVIGTTTTDAQGHYRFDNLPPGTYGVHEVQPAGYFDGDEHAGSAGGIVADDLITNVALVSGTHATHYDFCEVPPVGISGRVVVDTGGDCQNDPNATPIAGVTIQLLDAQGHVIGTTTTDAQGHYSFDGLPPGTYRVHEVQPGAFFDGDEHAGSVGGTVSDDLIADIVLLAGTHATQYDFCEVAPAILSGHVFQDGPPIELQNPNEVPDVKALRDGKLTPDDTLLAGVTLQLRDGITGLPIFGSAALPGLYAAGQPITTVTDANGYYEFRGLPAGVYGVFDTKLNGYIDGIDTPGSLGGVVISSLAVTDPAVLAALLAQPSHDAILAIALPSGGNSTDNNFSVVVTAVPQFFIFPQPPASPAIGPPLAILPPFQPMMATPLLPTPLLLAPVLTRAGGELYTWHLSVVDAGQPRGPRQGESIARLTSLRPDDAMLWQDDEFDYGEFILPFDVRATGRFNGRKLRFGPRGGIPISGDFNGDGKTEIGVFKDGQWFIDLNDNGIWDAGDLWAKLGHKGDRPVTGDWDGDGKTDIGVYGPAWRGDPRAVAHEPGIPDPHNENTGVQKNIPRPPERTTVGQRTLKLTSTGRPRADLIDHVFFYGTPGDHPVVGDWNGDGTHTIAIFRDGVWHRDTDGDGKWSKADRRAIFGQAGDLPVVGDFNGDGIDELGVYRDGTWYIDTNGNGVIDAEDQVFQLGGPGDIPVVGDWNGDGRAEPGVYHEASAPASKANTK